MSLFHFAYGSLGVVLALLLSVAMLNVVHIPSPTGMKKVHIVSQVAAVETIATPSATSTPIPVGYCITLPVIEYHHIQPWDVAVTRGQTSLSVDPNFFDQQMQYIAQQGYTTLTSEQLITNLLSHSPLPQKSVVITIDDGYEDAYTYAFPILQKYHLIANIMIPTGLLGGQGNNQYLSWDELKQMVQSGTFFADDHTWSHYAMGSSTQEKDQFEIMTAKNQLETNLHIHVSVFTYPYGTGSNNPAIWEELRQDGFIGGFSDSEGKVQCVDDIFNLKRTHIGNAPLSVYGL